MDERNATESSHGLLRMNEQWWEGLVLLYLLDVPQRAWQLQRAFQYAQILLHIPVFQCLDCADLHVRR